VTSHKIDRGSDSRDKGQREVGARAEHVRSWRHIQLQTGVQKQEVCSTVLSEVDSVHSGRSSPFLHGGRVFPITLRGADAALRVNKIGFACKGDRLT
jgi:hypothetical protein